MKNAIIKITVFLLGSLTGCLFAGAMTQSILQQRKQTYYTIPTTVAPTPHDSSEIFMMDLSGYGERDITTIAAAENSGGEPKKAKDMILQNMDKLTTPFYQSIGYHVLASAEIDLGRPENALSYAEKSVELSPNEANLLLLTQVYEYKKNLPKALETYQKLLTLNTSESRIDQEFLVSRVNAIRQKMGTPAP